MHGRKLPETARRTLPGMLAASLPLPSILAASWLKPAAIIAGIIVAILVFEFILLAIVVDQPHAGRKWLVVNLVLVLVLALGPFLYVRSADRAYAAGRRAHQAGDCTQALDQYQRVRGSYRYAPVADKSRIAIAECEHFLRAERARSSKMFSAAVDQYRSYEKDYPQGLLRPLVHTHAADTYGQWAHDLARRHRYVDAVRTYQIILVDYGDTKAAATAGSAIDATYRTAVTPYTRRDYCGALSVLSQFAKAPTMTVAPAKRTVTSARASLPRALYGCGLSSLHKRAYATAIDVLTRLTSVYPRSAYARLAAGPRSRALFGQAVVSLRQHDDEKAVLHLARLVRDYPRSDLAGQARAMIASANARIAARRAAERQRLEAERIRDLIDEFIREGTNRLPPPVRVGSSGSGAVSLTLLNDSPEALRILISGPKSYDLRIQACRDCVVYFGTVVPPCQSPDKLPTRNLTVPPGNYLVAVVATTDPAVRPFVGRWDLAGGARYRDCFYIMSAP